MANNTFNNEPSLEMISREVDDGVDNKNMGEHIENNAPIAQNELLETRYSTLNRVQSVRAFWKAILFCTILLWSALNDGFQQQVPGNILSLPAFVAQLGDTVVNGQRSESAKVVSYWQGFAEMSKTLGMFAGGTLMDRFGRKPAMITALVILLAGSIAEIASQKWQDWLGAAVLVRLGVGLAQTILITYVSELAPFQVRGFMIGAYQVLLTTGQLIVAIAAKLMEVHQPTKWRPLIAIEFMFTGVSLITIWFVPESHIFHARRNEHEKAKKSMLQLYGTAPGYDVEWEYRVVQEGIEVERKLFHSNGASFFDIFRGNNWRRTLAGSVGICSQWAAGAPIVFSYSTYFFTVAGLDNPFLVSILTFLLGMIAQSSALWLCEIYGRRPLLVGGCFLMCIFNIAIASTSFSSSAASGKAGLACLLLWVICYGLSAGPIGFVAAGETSTPHLRAQTTSFNLGCYGLGFVVFQWSISYMISPDAANLGLKAIYIWAGLLVPTTIILYLFYPETYGRTYWELDELYDRKIPAWRFKNTKTSSELAGHKNKQLVHYGH
ncbi:uncharacterized protein IL334_006043 [Kwoniella shivajii]|uniref:Major facilitator superfamily (MFS) profile domain-containing protein n=1 Tax=Kwoniella shivajii TaxID=564305 RepID=A0ABZ1D564_9TREE|nr:hypothetical protein IL334_006043 [Kwoniella shivajii]